MRLSEIYDTIQGEASMTGRPAVFIRTQGCDVGCPWCDTKHTWNPALARLPDIAEDKLVPYVLESDTRRQQLLWVFTGGEPCQYDLSVPTRHVHELGTQAQIETSGTYPIRCHPDTWVTVSPKVGMPGKRNLDASALDRANELKHVVGKRADLDLALQLWGMVDRRVPLWLQPLSQSEKATRLCIDACLEHGCRLSTQTHKYLQIP